MKAPHLRFDRRPEGGREGEIPAVQARALHRRRELEAQQRAFQGPVPGRESASAADLTPVRRRPRGS